MGYELSIQRENEENKITKEECLSYINQAYDKGLSF